MPSPRFVALLAILTIPGVRPLAAQPISCPDEPLVDGGPSPDLYCFDLLPTPAAPGASGRIVLSRPDSPFVLTVTPDGSIRYAVSVEIAGLPDPDELGARGFVAWATTPTLDPLLPLGPVGEGRTAAGEVDLDKFMVLVTAEPDPGNPDPGRRGRIVLRGMSPSTRMQPHLLPELLAEAGGRGRRADGGGWTPPPMHPGVTMLPGLERLRPDVTPYRPPYDPADLPEVRPRTLVELDDGDTLALVAEPVRRTLRGRSIVLYGFDGQVPGPLIRVEKDAEIVIDFTNRIDLPMTIHWHGIRIENRFDGVPGVTQEAVQPGGRFVYRIRFPDAGIYWYHPHHREDVLQDLGLYGNLLVDPGQEGWYGPAHRDEIVVLDDLLVGVEGPIAWGQESATHALMGRFGNVPIVNGETGWSLPVRRGEVIRFHLTNVSNTRTWNLSFGGAPTKLVATDVGRFEREERVGSVVIAPAERYVVEVRFDAPGRVPLVNHVQAVDHVYGSFLDVADTLGWVDVADEPARPDLGAAFDRLRENEAVVREVDRHRDAFERPVDRTLVLTLEADDLPFPLPPLLRLDSIYFHPAEWSGTMPRMNWTATAARTRWILRDPDTGAENLDIDWRFRVGETVKVRLVNDRDAAHAMHHPIHLHGQRFLVLAVNGEPVGNRAWKDTVVVPAGGTVDILLELSNPGRWMLHCHISEHLEAGMKMVFEAVGPDPLGQER